MLMIILFVLRFALWSPFINRNHLNQDPYRGMDKYLHPCETVECTYRPAHEIQRWFSWGAWVSINISYKAMDVITDQCDNLSSSIVFL